VARVDLSSSAQKDLARVLKTLAGSGIKRIVLQDLAAEPWPANLDVTPLAECKARSVTKGYLVDRVVNRRDLERILKAYR
jgi:hypothetical protein